MSLIDLTATELLARLESGETTSVEATRAYLDRIQRYDAQVGAFLRAEEERALAQAEAIDQKRRRKQSLGRLAGLERNLQLARPVSHRLLADEPIPLADAAQAGRLDLGPHAHPARTQAPARPDQGTHLTPLARSVGNVGLRDFFTAQQPLGPSIFLPDGRQ